MKEYELTILIHPDLEVDIEKALTKVRNIIGNVGGKIINEDNWGKKKLAYNIAKEEFAIYVFMNVMLPADATSKISDTLNITDEVIRYLLVKVDLKARKALEEAKKAAVVSVESSEQDN